MSKLMIAVLFGGCSPEHGVSLQSAAILRHMDQSRYEPVMVGISRAGDWFRYTGPVDSIESNTWYSAETCSPAVVCLNRSVPALLMFGPEGMQKVHMDAASPVLHGRNGEDRTVQGFFELAAIPLVGCAVLGSETLTVGEPDEIELVGEFFNFTEKYPLETSAIHAPARIPMEQREQIKADAKRIYRALGCQGFARVDQFLTPDGRLIFNEVNTILGFTGSMAALSSRIKDGSTAPPVKAVRFSRSLLHHAYPLHIRDFPRSDIPIFA